MIPMDTDDKEPSGDGDYVAEAREGSKSAPPGPENPSGAANDDGTAEAGERFENMRLGDGNESQEGEDESFSAAANSKPWKSACEWKANKKREKRGKEIWKMTLQEEFLMRQKNEQEKWMAGLSHEGRKSGRCGMKKIRKVEGVQGFPLCVSSLIHL